MFNIGGQTTGDYGKTSSDYKRKADYWSPEQKKTSQSLYQGAIAPGFRQYGDIYAGQPTDIEQTALGQLQAYGQQTPQYMGEAQGAMSRALTGTGYNNIVDPAAAEKLYGAIEDRTMKDILPKAVESASTQANVGGMLRSGTGQQLVTDQIGQVVRALSEQLAGLKYSDEQTRRNVAREREARQLQAVPQVGNLSSAEFGRIMPGLQYGGMERDIAGTQFDNPLTRLAMSYLGLRGQAKERGSGSKTGWNIGQSVKGGFGME
jgi:hypothetical protein